MTGKPPKKKYSKGTIIKIIITVIGIIGSVASIYGVFFQTKEKDLYFEIISQTNVFDLNEELNDLDIIYRNRSLKDSEQNITIYLVKTSNDGSSNILLEDYDENDPIGISITNGLVVSNPEVVNTSNSYLNKNLILNLDTTNTIFASKVILESGQSFTFKLVVMHKTETLPIITPIGKIAGIVDDFNISYKETSEITFAEKVFKGNFIVQSIRTISYFLFFVAIAIVIILTGKVVQIFFKTLKRKSLVKVYKRFTTPTNFVNQKVLKTYYQKGDNRIQQYYRSLANEDSLIKGIKGLEIINQKINDLSEDLILNLPKIEDTLLDIVQNAIKDDLIYFDKMGLKVNQKEYDKLKVFYDFLESRNALTDKTFTVVYQESDDGTI